MRIAEVELLPDLGQTAAWRHDAVRDRENPYAGGIRAGSFRPVARIKGHTIYYRHSEGQYGRSIFIAVDDDSGMVDMRLAGTARHRHNMVMFDIKDLDGRKGSKLKAHEFYHAILRRGDAIFTTQQQSYGGLRTWQQLAKYPDIEVFGWSRGKPVNVTPDDPDDTHATQDDVSRGEPEEPEARGIMNMKLVAHKKLGRKHGA